MSFANLSLCDEIIRALTDQGYENPTPIQAQAIPAVLSGQDLLASAQTGTGKTASFTLPILQRLTGKDFNDKPGHKPRIKALILVPTRELAIQVEESISTYGKYLRLNSISMIGGVSIKPQIKQLRGKVDILVSTPGRLLDHIEQKTIDLSGIKILVLDEADRMLDMGFIHNIKKILKLLPPQRQNLLFSATFSNEIKTLADKLLNKPAMLEVTPRNTTAEMITHKVYPVDSDKKRALLSELIKKNNWHQVLIFTKTKHGANRLAEYLTTRGINSLAIHGNKSQSARVNALNQFKDGTLQTLVATDIAARGIDIADLPHVVNFELPNVPEDYVHRIGRTGRAGQTGDAVSLVSPGEQKLLVAIERLLKKKIDQEIITGFEPNPHAMNIAMADRDAQPRSQKPKNNNRNQAKKAPLKKENSSAPKSQAKAKPKKPFGAPKTSNNTSKPSNHNRRNNKA